MRKREQGFTLLELLVLLTLIGITVSLLSLRMTGLINFYRLRVSTNTVISSLYKCKQLAITKYSPYVTKLIESNKLVIYKKDTTEYIDEIELELGITATQTRNINFYPLGTAWSGSITLLDCQGNSYKVVVSSSGRIRCEKL